MKAAMMLRDRRWRLGAGYGLALAAVGFVVHSVGVNSQAFLDTVALLTPVQLLASLGLFVVCTVLNAAAFAHLLATQRVISGASWLAALPAKYVPIGVGHIVGRGALLVRHGVSRREVVRTAWQEQALSLCLCTAAAGMAWSAMRGSVGWVIAIGGMFLVLLVCVAGVVATTPVSLRSHARTVAAVCLYAAALVPFAGGYLVLLQPAGAAVPLANLFGGTVVGMLAVLAPGGLGIREAVVGAAAADPSAVFAGLAAARLMILFAEIILCASGYLVLALQARTGS